ncbi:glucosaminidase domain-containing protein [Paenibacillus agricola]|uniref:Peptidoglycan DD-metalloendopeptidase family protein n=1 Tax=Paenibacillus agricola TaxID=2716264 RepID=A0ABX0J9P1_9BACL|nr:glucosaminidase domain-containing protein [Paenibacillus agricola]NHN33140.1 peptidoglycan DD-metalloendopeptidase family protein [Paenibacillus agricola]
MDGMNGFPQGNMQKVASGVGNHFKDKLKQVVKRLIKEVLKKLAKLLFQLLLKLIAKAIAALVALFGIPVLICIVVIIVVGGALVYVRWIGGDDAATIQRFTAAYNAAIVKTSALEEYRPPLIVVQMIDNMRIIKLGLDPEDIDPSSVANALKPDLVYQNFVNTQTIVNNYTDSEGNSRSNTSTNRTTVSLLVEAHAWNRDEVFTYSQNTKTESYPSTYITTTTWVRNALSCSNTNTGYSPAPSLTGIGTKTHPFFKQYGPIAQEESRKSGVPASVTLAQAVEEGGWGTSELASKYFNFFGIKKHNWTGNTVSMWTNEVINGITQRVLAEFRAYPNAIAGFADHTKFLLDNSRYAAALSMNNPYEFANEIHRAGYATNPNYSTNLKNLMHDYNLLQYDKDGGKNPETGLPWEDVGYIPGSSTVVLANCGIPNFNKFDAVLMKYNLNTDDVELVSAGIQENDPTRLMLYGYNGNYGISVGGPLVGSEDGSYVDMPPVLPGQMIWPTTATIITSNFGMRVNPTNGVLKQHKGMDIAPANSDTREFPNIAAMDGIVILAGDASDGYGYKVVIDHGGGLETLYAHMKAGSLKVSKGQQVKAGTVLGTMGQTGDVTGRHLHFEVHYNGNPVNPAAYVTRNVG